MRAEFRIWHQDGVAHYAMTRPGTKQNYIIEPHFPIASVTINRLMPPLLAQINLSDTLKRKLFAVEFLSTQTGEALITLIYHRPLDDHWTEAAAALEKVLGIFIIGRSRKQKIVVCRDFVRECLRVNGRDYHYLQIEGGFTQPNAQVNEQMLGWAEQAVQGLGGDLLELYCGNGNFTNVLAGQFNRVLATEIAKVSVASARENFKLNGVDNVVIARMSSEELTQAMNGVRAFRRLEGINLADYEFSTVFVDPPRAGLDAGTVALVSNFTNILYISCNPLTLLDNINQLSASHEVRKFALFDQFPWTEHMECGVLMSKKLAD